MSDIEGLTHLRHHLNVTLGDAKLVAKVECMNHATCSLVELIERDMEEYPQNQVPTFLEWFDGEEPELLRSGEIAVYPEAQFVAWAYVNPEPTTLRVKDREGTTGGYLTGEITPYWGVSVEITFTDSDGTLDTFEVLGSYGGLEGEQFREGPVTFNDISLWDEPEASTLIWQYL